MLRRLLFQTRHLRIPDSVFHFSPSSFNIYRQLCETPNVGESEKRNEDSHVSGSFASKYRLFRDEDSPVILDVQEERLNIERTAQDIEPHEEFDEFYGLSLARGLTSVFEVEELVQILRKENVLDIFVASVPPEIKYVDYLVVVTGKSPRHMYATAEFIRRVFKKKRYPNDAIPKIEGKTSRDWIAMDLGNIALHIFSKTARLTYDLESLWSVGAAFDGLYNKSDDPVVELLLQHSVYLGDLNPTETNS